MAIQKLFLNQAKIDSVEVSESQVIQETDRWINFAINQMGSKEKLEEYFGKKISQLKDERKEMIMEQQTVEPVSYTHLYCRPMIIHVESAVLSPNVPASGPSLLPVSYTHLGVSLLHPDIAESFKRIGLFEEVSAVAIHI